MNKENASKLWKMIREAGDYLYAKLFAFSNTTLVNVIKYNIKILKIL